MGMLSINFVKDSKETDWTQIAFLIFLSLIAVGGIFGYWLIEKEEIAIALIMPKIPLLFNISNVNLEEYLVYSAFIETRYPQKDFSRIVIQENTVSKSLRSYIDADLLKKKLPELEEKIIKDFQDKDNQICHFDRRFVLDVDYTLLTNKERGEIFAFPDGWEIFYNNYPGANGIMEFSRVGFNSQRTKALIYQGNQSNWLAGMGQYILLLKKDGRWEIEKEVPAWIS